MRLQRAAAAAVSAVVLALSVSACGDDSSDGGGADNSQTPVIIEITENAGKISPDDGHVVEVAKGQEVQLNVSSDADDEIHVHSDPEHEFEIAAGEDKTFTFTIDTPGTIPIESHGLEVTIVKLQVS
jgi:hypothetical protein